MTQLQRSQLLLVERTLDGDEHRPSIPQSWQQKLWLYGTEACNPRCGLLLTGRRTGTLTLKPLIACHIGFMFLDSLIHLLRGQLALIFSYFGVQDMSDLLFDSIQRDLILEGSELFLHELILPIFAQITHRGADSYQKVYGSLLRPLAEILYGISLLS